MPESPQVIVVTPTLGRSLWLDQAVDSVTAHRAGRVRLDHILVAPADQVDALAVRYPSVTVLAEPEGMRGLYEAVNYGANRSGNWRWLTYLNDDDLLRTGFDQILDCAEAGGADVIYGGVSYIGANGEDLGVFPVESRARRFASLMAAGIPPFTQQGTLIRRECFERLGGFNTDYRLAADFDFWVRTVVCGASFRHLRAEVATFRLRAGQLSADQTGVQAELASIIADHFPKQSRWTRLLVRTAFRLRHVPAILARRRRTGSWRTGGSTWRVPE